MCACSVVSDPLQPLLQMDCSLLSMGFSRQEYQSGLPFPPPRDRPDPVTEPTSLALVGGFFTTASPGKPTDFLKIVLKTEIISHELPRWSSGCESACRCRRHRFSPCSGRVPHSMVQVSPCATTAEPTC